MERKSHYRGLIALQLVPGLGLQRARILLQQLRAEDASELFRCSIRELTKTDGIGENVAGNLVRFNEWQKVDRILLQTQKAGARFIAFDDEHYPELLRHIYDPPLILWLRGSSEALTAPGIGVVGTRRPGRYGLSQTVEWVKNLVSSNVSVNSGLAYGVDTAAHRETLDAGGKTVAVLGSGINVIYPARNSGLAKRITEQGGALITEYPPNTPPDAVNFPGRNRIVSGMSHGILVVESGIKGGSMITARYALDQNREVFVVPHPLGYAGGEGCNYLIRTGQGKLVQTPDDIFDELSIGPADVIKSTQLHPGEAWKKLDLSPGQTEICKALNVDKLHIDVLCEKLNLPGYKVLPEMLELEMRGVVRQSAGKYFELV
ncbi:DNA-processing protein DprA [Rhodohalobacter mucosus]|uniref:DNA-processing protein DprA n=1 Tax=Rhodohalobacter mucosus TaxID=2079485 RepID=UPI001304AFB8|nr:DNA-processing protein DprA [Rhodohalobacter mucosus]